MYRCCFCQSENSKREVVASEMMLGYRDEFSYIECAECASLQIKQVPSDLSKYYPNNYYSFSPYRAHALKRWLKKSRFDEAWGHGNLFGRLLVNIFGPPDLVSWLKPTGVTFQDAILDVGSGSGKLLLQLHEVGFKNLTGIDPYIKNDMTLRDTVQIFKRELNKITGSYDLIMFNHSLEHMFDPREALRVASGLLKSGKSLMIHIPVAGNYAWQTYGVNWVQLDAPRHLCVPTERGLRALAQLTGFDVDSVSYTSTSFQFWGSEQYQQDIPLKDDKSYDVNSRASIFSQQDIQGFERKAAQLNQTGDGDSACFFLRRSF